jgi:hypothetical protein
MQASDLHKTKCACVILPSLKPFILFKKMKIINLESVNSKLHNKVEKKM